MKLNQTVRVQTDGHKILLSDINPSEIIDSILFINLIFLHFMVTLATSWLEILHSVIEFATCR